MFWTGHFILGRASRLVLKFSGEGAQSVVSGIGDNLNESALVYCIKRVLL